MSFEEFLYYIEEHILDGWMEEAHVRVQETRKNNGVTYQGLYIRDREQSVTPCIYMEEYYEDYQKGESADDIITRIRRDYQWAVEHGCLYEVDVTDYGNMQDRIIFRLVNYTKNEDVLKNCPHIRLYDLALTFRWIAHTDDIGISTALVTDRELRIWGITVQELLLTARENTRRIFPPKIVNMDHYLEEFGKDMTGMDTGSPMYIMTNEQQINGATVLVYEGVLQQFAGEIRSDFFLLPSSIHEMILIPERSHMDAGILLDMVREANRSIVSPVDFLSGSVYYYSRKNNRITPVRKDGGAPEEDISFDL